MGDEGVAQQPPIGMDAMFDVPADADFWAWMAHPLWRYGPTIDARIYAGFNLVEAAAWFAIAAWALRRYVGHRRSLVEPLYVALLVVFGFSDVLESHRVTLWLVLAKLLIFSNLIVTRLYLVRVHYPGWRM